jgi:hypothetical protein
MISTRQRRRLSTTTIPILHTCNDTTTMTIVDTRLRHNGRSKWTAEQQQENQDQLVRYDHSTPMTDRISISKPSEERDDMNTISTLSNDKYMNRRKKKRKRRQQQQESQYNRIMEYCDRSFLRLFINVFCIVCLIGITFYMTYIRLFHIPTFVVVQNMNNNNNDDDDDDMNHNVAAAFIESNNPNNHVDTTDSSTTQYIMKPLFQLDQIKQSSTNIQQQQVKDKDGFGNIPSSSSSSEQQFPLSNLSYSALHYDAYAIAELYEKQQQSQSNHDNYKRKTKKRDTTLFWQIASSLRAEFANLYGGINAARFILDRAISTFGTTTTTTTTIPSSSYDSSDTTTIKVLPDDLYVTACRIWSKRQQDNNAATDSNSHPNQYSTTTTKKQQNIFYFAFGGYSVTAGRGNLFSQSYPFIMQQQLQTIFTYFDIELIVRNAAMYVFFVFVFFSFSLLFFIL